MKSLLGAAAAMTLGALGMRPTVANPAILHDNGDIVDTSPSKKRKGKSKKALPVFTRKMDDPVFREHVRSHPGRNPNYNGGGNRYFERSRWVPHSGAKEAARHAGR